MATSKNAQTTIIDFALVMPNYRFCVIPYSKIKGNITITDMGVSGWYQRQYDNGHVIIIYKYSLDWKW